MVKDAKAAASPTGGAPASSHPSSLAAPPSPATTPTAAAAAAASAPPSPSAVRYPSPALVVEGLGFVLNQDLVDFANKKNLLTVSKDVRDTTRTSVLGLSGDERLLPILGKFGRLRHLSINFEKSPEDAQYQTAGVDLSVVTPLLQCLEVRTRARPEEGEKKIKKKKNAKREGQSTEGNKTEVGEENGGGGSEMIVLDADEVGEHGEAQAAAAAGDDGGKRSKKRRSKSHLKPQGGKSGKKSKTGAEADLEESDTKPAAAGTAAPKAVLLEPCTLLTGLRSMRCLTSVTLLCEGMGAVAEKWVEEQLPPSLEKLVIRGPVLLNLGFGPLTRLVRAGRLPRLTSLLVGRSIGRFAADFLQPSPDATIGVFIELLTSLTRATTPRLQYLAFQGGLPPLVDEVWAVDDDGGGWLDLLLGEYPKWEAQTKALRHWWTAAGERPPHLQQLKVEDRNDVEAVPKLLKTGDPRLVELGTLLYASVGTFMYLDELDFDGVVALVDQLEERHSHYARAQAVRALACYVHLGGDYLSPNDHPELFHRARDLLYKLVHVALAAPTGQEGGPPPDPALSFLTKYLLSMVSAALAGDENVTFFDLSDVDFEAIAVLAVKVLAFRCPSKVVAQRSASTVLLHILREDIHVRGVWEGSMAAMAQRGLRATKEEGKRGVYADVAARTISTVEGDETAGTVMMIRLLLRMFFGRPDSPSERVRVPVKPLLETLLLFLSQNVALLFEALRAQRLLAPVVAVLFHDRSTPSLLWICSHLDTPHWVPGFIVDVLLRRIEAPPFQGFAKHLTTALAAGTKKIPSDLPIDPARYHVATGRVLLLETLLAPERSSAFFTALAADAKQVGSVTLFNLLKVVASRGLLGPGGVVGAVERQQLAEAADVLKLVTDASPEALCVLRALKGEPVDHLRDVLARIQVVAVKAKSGKMRPLKVSLFEELLVSLAGLDAASTSAQTIASMSSSSVNGAAARSISSSAAAAAAAAAAASSSPLSSLSSNLRSVLNATLTQLGEDEVVNRLRDFMESCKVRRKVNMMGVPQGKQQWKKSPLRILALALSSLTVFSDVFVKMLAGPGVAARQAAANAASSKAAAAKEKVDKKETPHQSSCAPPAPRSTESFLEFWTEVIASVEKVPVLALGLARAATKERDVLRGLIKLAAYSGSNVGRLARALAMLTTTGTHFPHASSGSGLAIAASGGGDGGRGGGAAAAAAAALNSGAAPSDKGEDDGDVEPTAKAGQRGAAIEHPYIRRALSIGVPAVDPAAIVDCLRVQEGAVTGRGSAFRLNKRIPFLVMSLFALPAMTAAVLGSKESSFLVVRSDFPVARMLLEYQRARLASGGRPSVGTSSSSSSALSVGAGSGSGSAFFDKSMMEVLLKCRTEGGLDVGKAEMSYLMKESTLSELIGYRAFRTLRILTIEEPAFVLPHVLDVEGIVCVELRIMAFEFLKNQPKFSKACVERYLPELLAFLDRSVDGKTGVSSLEIVAGIMASVPDFLSRVAMLLKKEREEKGEERGVGSACVQGLVGQWSKDRRVNRGDNKAVIEQFAALLRVGVGGGGGGEEGDDKEKKEEEEKEEEKEKKEETVARRPTRGKK